MKAELNQIVTKTPQGVSATRNGDGLLPKSHALLKLFDGAKPLAELKKVSAGAGISAAEFAVAMKELKTLGFLSEVDPSAEALAVEVGDDFLEEDRLEADLHLLGTEDAPGVGGELGDEEGLVGVMGSEVAEEAIV